MKKYLGHIVDVVSREIYDGEVVVEGDYIKQVKRCNLPDNGKTWPYLMPGFIDSHVHIESSMMTPYEFAHLASSHGTIGVIADPHEIGNVLGIEGVDYMIRSGRDATFNFCFAAPSCVPCYSPDIETSGAVIDAAGVEELMARDDIGVLGEMMNFTGVLGNDPEVMLKIRAAHKYGKPIDGHAPGLTGNNRERYAMTGISTDHECTSIEEGRACISAGMKVIIRNGSAAKDFENLYPLIGESPNMVMFCTDDCHPDDLVRGHINLMVRRALADGYDIWKILMAASINLLQSFDFFSRETCIFYYRLYWQFVCFHAPCDFKFSFNQTCLFAFLHAFSQAFFAAFRQASLLTFFVFAFSQDVLSVNGIPKAFVCIELTLRHRRLLHDAEGLADLFVLQHLCRHFVGILVDLRQEAQPQHGHLLLHHVARPELR